MLSQKRYIDITTGKGSVSVGSRNLQALVITDSSAQTGYAFDADNDIDCTSVDAVGKAFGTSSKEYLWASMYFAYSDPNGNAPTRLTFAKYVSTDLTPVAAFNRIVSRTNDFGVFTFLTTLTPAQINAVASANAGLNYRFEFVAAICLSDVNGSAYKTSANPLKALRDACVGSDGSSGAHLVYQKTIALTGDTISVPKTYILSAVMSAIDWEQTDGTVSPMFRTISDETADVTNESSVRTNAESGEGVYDWTYTEVGADDLDDLDINYYGQVQINGTQRSFYQKGMNTDAESALVFMGEVWLKSEISSRIMELMLSLSKIKANADGNAKIYSTVVTVCTDALDNGVIEIGKELDNAQRIAIRSISQDSEAPDIIESRGYWLKAWIEKDDDGKNYKAKYLLLYSKEDIIVKVEGSDILY